MILADIHRENLKFVLLDYFYQINSYFSFFIRRKFYWDFITQIRFFCAMSDNDFFIQPHPLAYATIVSDPSDEKNLWHKLEDKGLQPLEVIFLKGLKPLVRLRQFPLRDNVASAH